MQIPYHRAAFLQGLRTFTAPSFVHLAQDLHLVLVEKGPGTGDAAHHIRPAPELNNRPASSDKKAAL
jgi:hypothetical protein